MAADIKQKHGTTTALTFAAGLQSLATSATVGQVSAEVDNTTNLFDEVEVTVTAQMTTAGTPTGLIEVYLLASLDGTKYNGDVSSYSGTEASYTLGAAGSPNLIPLGVIRPHANTSTYRGVFSIAQTLGSVPPFWAIVIVNNSAIALHSSGNGADYRGIYHQST